MTPPFNWLPGHRKRNEESETARLQAELTSLREDESDATIRHAYTLAHRLAEHRRQNHFAQRIRAAYEGGDR